jgi:hypothetical protein
MAYGTPLCACCGAVDGVEDHHLYLRSDGCPDDLTVWLCHVCHGRARVGTMNMIDAADPYLATLQSENETLKVDNAELKRKAASPVTLDELRERTSKLLRDMPKDERKREISRFMRAADLSIHDWVSATAIGKRDAPPLPQALHDGASLDRLTGEIQVLLKQGGWQYADNVTARAALGALFNQVQQHIRASAGPQPTAAGQKKVWQERVDKQWQRWLAACSRQCAVALSNSLVRTFTRAAGAAQ